MSDKMYRILLDDYACPSFCSFAKPYLGTREEIDAFIAEYGKHRKDNLAKRKELYLNQLLTLYEAEQSQRHSSHLVSVPSDDSLLDENGKTKPDSHESALGHTNIPRTEDGKINFKQLRMKYGLIAENIALVLFKQKHDEYTYDGAWQRFCDGESDVKVAAAMGLWSFVEDVEIAAEKSFSLKSNDATVSNIYDYKRDVRWDTGDAKVCWIKTYTEYGGEQNGNNRIRQESYMKAMKLSFSGFSTYNDLSKYWEFPHGSWGIFGILEMKPEKAIAENIVREDGRTVEVSHSPKGDISTRLWLVEKYFTTKEEMLSDIEASADVSEMDLDLSIFWQEIVADG